MLYKFDPYKFACQLCPPILRSKIMLSIVKALCTPLRYISDALNRYRAHVKETINTTSNVVVIEGVLNDAFHLTERQIYITTRLDLGEVHLFQSGEDKVTYLYTKDEKQPLMMLMKDGAPAGASFTVHVPNFLATSINYEEDDLMGVNMSVIRDVVTKHKPVGKSYTIEIYEYE